jgi:hypothetical protein
MFTRMNSSTESPKDLAITPPPAEAFVVSAGVFSFNLKFNPGLISDRYYEKRLVKSTSDKGPRLVSLRICPFRISGSILEGSTRYQKEEPSSSF